MVQVGWRILNPILTSYYLGFLPILVKIILLVVDISSIQKLALQCFLHLCPLGRQQLLVMAVDSSGNNSRNNRDDI